MSKSKEVIEYVKVLRDRKLLWEDLATQESPVFPSVDETELKTKVSTLETHQARLQNAYAAIRTSDTESLLLSRVLVSGKQVSLEIEELRGALTSQHPKPSALTLESQIEALELDILRLELELEERGTTTLLDKLMGVTAAQIPLKPEPLLVGALIDSRYRVDQLLSEGDRCAIYRVSDQNTPQQWVVKEIWGEQCFLSQEQIDRLDQEIRRLSGMRHPSLPRIVDAMAEQGRFFMVTDTLNGVRLEDVLKNTGPLTPDKGLPICLQVCEAVRYLHQQSPPFEVTDLSSRRVMVDASGRIKITSSDLSHRIDAPVGTSVGLGKDLVDLSALILEILGEPEKSVLSQPLKQVLQAGLQGQGLDLDQLVRLLGEEIRGLRKEEPQAAAVVSAVANTEPAEAEEEPEAGQGVRARGSKLSVFYRGVKKVVGKIATNV